MRIKKVISIIMVSLLFISGITGCSMRGDKDKTNDSDNQTALGKYMEGNIEFPEGIASSEYISLANKPGGGMELFTLQYGNYVKYNYENKKWEKDNGNSLQKFHSNPTASNLKVIDVFYGQDDKQYILCDNSNNCNELYRQTENEKYEQIDIPKLKEEYGDFKIPSRPKNITVLKNGLIAAIYLLGEIEVYSSDGKSVVNTFNSTNSGKIAADGNNLYYTNQKGNEIIMMDMETNKQGASRELSKKLSEETMLEVDNGVVYLCDKSGIQLNKEGSSIWETLVDGNQSKLSMPLYTLSRFILGTESDYYLVMKEDKGVMINRYYYDQTVNSVPSKELSIFSLNESKTIRQAISVFQESHPDVKMNYQVANSKPVSLEYGVSNSEDLAAQTDYVNALNTELLAKKGADILVLDGLPVDSYIEKGVLEDMGSIFAPKLESGELMENIADNYKKDDKVYVMPVRFALPMIYGCSDAVNSTDTLENLATYAKKNSKIPLLAPSKYRSLAAWFLLTYYDQMINNKNEIDKEMFRNYLEEVNQLAVNIDASDDVDINGVNEDGITKVGYWINSALVLNKKLVRTNMEEIVNLDSFAIPLEATKEWKGSYKVVNKTYRASSLVGMNSAGTQKDLAKEFIQLLFSNEIQSLNLADGFPIGKAALEGWIKQEEDKTYSMSNEDDTINAPYPALEDRNKIYKDICALSHPMVNDTAIINMILEESVRYLKGDITSEQATDNVLSRINRYLSE